jgi:hypothetical protein
VNTGDVQGTGAFEDVSLYLSDGFHQVGLEARFRQTAGFPLRFSAWAEQPDQADVVRITILGSTVHVLRLDAASVGETRVDVAASDDYGHADTLSFQITVLDDCPAPTPDGYVDYFPLQPGQAETYDYSRTFHDPLGNLRWWSGMLRREIVGEGACLRGVVSWTVRESLEGEWRADLLGYDEEVHGSFDETRTTAYILTDGGFSQLASGTLDPLVPRYISSSERDTVEVFRRPDGLLHWRLRLAREKGPVYWYTWDHRGVSYNDWTTLTRRPE